MARLICVGRVAKVESIRISVKTPETVRAILLSKKFAAFGTCGRKTRVNRGTAYIETQPLTSSCLASSCYVPPPRRRLVNAGILRFNGQPELVDQEAPCQTPVRIWTFSAGPTLERGSEGWFRVFKSIKHKASMSWSHLFPFDWSQHHSYNRQQQSYPLTSN
jgi:hypothetical protein